MSLSKTNSTIIALALTGVFVITGYLIGTRGYQNVGVLVIGFCGILTLWHLGLDKATYLGVFALLFVSIFQTVFEVLLGGGQLSGLISNLDELLVVGLLALAKLNAVLNNRLRLLPGEIAFYIICFVGGLSWIVVGYDVSVFVFQTFLTMKGYLVFLAFADSNFTVAQLKKIGQTAVTVGLVVVASAIITTIFRAQLGSLGLEVQSERWGISFLATILMGPDSFGWLMGFFFTMLLSFFVIYKDRKFLGLATIFFVAATLALRRRTLITLVLALIGVTAGWYYVSTRTQRRQVLIGATLFILVGTLITILSLPLLSDLVAFTIEEYWLRSDRNTRVLLYSTSVQIANDFFPFGAGPGRFASWMSRTNYSPLYYDYGLSTIPGLSPVRSILINDTFFPMIIGEYGYFGLLTFCGLLFQLARLPLDTLKQENVSKFMQAIGIGVLITFVNTIIASLAAPFLNAPPVTYIIFGALGIFYAVSRGNSKSTMTS